MELIIVGPPTYAHTLPDRPCSNWEPLERHLQEVATGNGSFPGAAGFAAVFGASDLARLAGLWHDLGKYAPAFQKYLHDSAAGKPVARGSVDHATAGALHALTRDKQLGLLLAFVIAGHHAGLADLGQRSANNEDESALLARIFKADQPESTSRSAISAAPPKITSQPFPPPPALLTKETADAPLRVSLLIRMLFSCLIDADRLATEAFVNPQQGSARFHEHASIAELGRALDTHLEAFAVSRAGDPSPVDAIRAQLLDTCRRKAELPPGLFSLTAPTGSGKTLSSMAFALRHAERHGMRRIIYALPFTSVTEQNARVFREAFAPLSERVVLEHHSAYRPSDEISNQPEEVWRRLAAENWDAPVIVTTNVQLLESLFSENPSRCRKLHRIAGSVIVLDEAQALPVNLLKPTLAALDELAKSYNVSVVLCSATMPAVTHRDDFRIGLKGVREIVDNSEEMALAMRRADVRVIGHLDDDELADRAAGAGRVLAIVNTRAHAARLYQLVKERADDVLHLSALMCPQHRGERVAEIKNRLKHDRPCRVISTQVVEAGVDIDFPVVYRAIAGLDSIVQAAGRCNREGRGPRGEVFVFETDVKPPSGILGPINSTRQVLVDDADPLDLDTITRFFRYHFWTRSREWDGGMGKDGKPVGITDMLNFPDLKLRTAAGRYKLIDEWAEPLVVPYGSEGQRICDLLQNPGLPPHVRREALRASQRFTVNVAPRTLEEMENRAMCICIADAPAVLVDNGAYDPQLGLLVDALPNPDRLIM